MRSARSSGAKCPQTQVAETLDVTVRTLQNWLGRFDSDGADGLRDLPREGRPPSIPRRAVEKAAEKLAADGDLAPEKPGARNPRNVGGAVQPVQREKDPSCPALLDKGGHCGPGVGRKRKERQEMAGRALVRCMRRAGYAITEMDEALFASALKSGKKKWSRIGEAIIGMMAGGHKRTVVYGALADDGSQLFAQYDRFDGDTFLMYLKETGRKWGKVVAMLGNARQHVAKRVLECVKSTGGRIILHFLPPGSPKLNAVEEAWHRSKYDLVASEYCEDIDSLADAITKYFRTKRFGLDIYSHIYGSV